MTHSTVSPSSLFELPMQLNYTVFVLRLSMQWQCFSLHNDTNLSPYLVMKNIFYDILQDSEMSSYPHILTSESMVFT